MPSDPAQLILPLAGLMMLPFLGRLLLGMLFARLFTWRRMLVVYLAMGGSLTGLAHVGWPLFHSVPAAEEPAVPADPPADPPTKRP
jgi:hypothetical protein